MIFKNLLLLVVLTWVSFSYAKHPVAQESWGEAEKYRVEKPVKDQKADRTVAGGKTKHKIPASVSPSEEMPASETDSEVRYWQYSE